MYRDGLGVERDLVKARGYFESALPHLRECENFLSHLSKIEQEEKQNSAKCTLM